MISSDCAVHRSGRDCVSRWFRAGDVFAFVDLRYIFKRHNAPELKQREYFDVGVHLCPLQNQGVPTAWHKPPVFLFSFQGRAMFGVVTSDAGKYIKYPC